jgi:protein-disulfide isomerase
MLKYAVLLGLLAFPATAKEEFDRRVIDAILKNPEVILLAIEKLRVEDATAQANRQLATVANIAPDLFNDADLVEFFDYRCGYCARSAEDMAKLPESELARVAFIELPILGQASTEIAKVALAVKDVAGEEAYRRFHFEVFRSAGLIRDRSSALALAETLQLDVAGIEAMSLGTEIAETLQGNRALARKLGITGTPAFLSKDGLHEGLMPLDSIKSLVSEKEDASSNPSSLNLPH